MADARSQALDAPAQLSVADRWTTRAGARVTDKGAHYADGQRARPDFTDDPAVCDRVIFVDSTGADVTNFDLNDAAKATSD